MNERTAFENLLDLADDGERARYLEQLGKENTQLRDRVLALLHSHEQGGSFLQGHPITEMDTVATSVSPEPGHQIDRYKIREKLGEGGFGTVYVAEQMEPVRRKVALKIIKPGMDSRQVIARFKAERQALALMNHPNIATVLDAGRTDSGHPYFVMELVSGIPITTFCEENRLDLAQRLQLFIDLCHAIQHAHQKGIIHRDLKPSNVLVTRHDDKPVVKVIDFGVAKALNNDDLTEATTYTAYGQMLGTPMYMSPEQAQLSGLDIDTRSDVYSLGLLLYELLTGTTPVERERLHRKGVEAIRRIICEEVPVRPSVRVSTLDAKRSSTVSNARNREASRLGQLYRGELDWVVMKSLEKDRNRRYESAGSFAADVKRYLKNEPVFARPPSNWYRFRKFAQRRKSTLVAGSLAAIIFLITVGTVGWIAQDRMIRRARLSGQTERLFDESEQLARQQRWEEAGETLERARTLIASGDANPRLYRQMEQLSADLGLVRQLDDARLLHNKWVDGEFDYAASNRAYTKAFADSKIDVRHLEPAAVAKKLRLRQLILPRVIAALDHWAWVTLKADESKIEAARRLVAISQQLDRDPIRRQLREALIAEDATKAGQILETSSERFSVIDQPVQSILLFADALHQAERPDRAIETLRRAQRRYPSDFFLNYGLAYKIREADRQDPDAVRYYSAALAASPESTAVMNNLALALGDQGKPEEAIAYFQRAVEIDPSFGRGHANLAKVLKEQGKIDAATVIYRRAAENGVESSFLFNSFGAFVANQGKIDESIRLFQKAVEIDPQDPQSYVLLGTSFHVKEDFDRAIELFRKAIEIDPERVVAYLKLAYTLKERGDSEEAIRTYREAFQLDATDAVPDDELAAHYNAWGELLKDSGKLNEAIVAYQEAIRLNAASAGHVNLGMLLKHSLGREKEAIAAFRRGAEAEASFLHVIHHQLALTLLSPKDQSLRDVDEAVVHAREAVRLKPTNNRFYILLARALDAAGDKDREVIRTYRAGLEKSEGFKGKLHGQLARKLANCQELSLRDPAEAIVHAKDALRLAPGIGGEASATVSLGMAYYRAGRWNESVETLKRVNELKGRSLTAWGQFFLAMAYWKSGKQANGRLYFDAAVDLMERSGNKDPKLRRLRAEAEGLLGDRNKSEGEQTSLNGGERSTDKATSD